MLFIDLVLAVVLIFGLIRGFWNGFLCELAGTVSLLVGIYIAIRFSGYLRDFVGSHFPGHPQGIRLAAFLLTFILVLIGIWFLSKFLTRIAKMAGLGLFNKILGGLLGIVKMLLIASVLISIFEKLNSEGALAEKEPMGDSVLYEPVRKAAPMIYPALREWLAEHAPEAAISTP